MTDFSAQGVVWVGGLVTIIAARIEADIRNGDLPPGTQLKSRRELAATYGVGESTIYSALDHLKWRGLIVGVAGVGVYVTDPTHWAPPRP